MYKVPKITVDGILIQNKEILLICRNHAPFQGMWALPGGFVNYGETTENAVVREFFEETGVTTKVVQLLDVLSDPKRDPRGHTITIVYLLKKMRGTLHAGDDATTAKFFKVDELPALAFDHKKIIKETLERISHGILSKM